MQAPSPRLVLPAVSVGLGVASLTVGFGAVDLVSPWVLHEGTQVTDVGFGTLTGLVIPIGLFAQARSAATHVAGVLQVGAAALAFLAAGLLTGEQPLLVAAAVLAAATAVVVTLHPARARLLRRPMTPSLPMLLLAVAACAPGSQYALHMAFNQRNGVLPSDAHLGLHHWAALSAATLAALFTAVLASFRTEGFVIPGYTAAAAVLAWGVACVAYPRNAGALGSTCGWLAVAWAVAFALATSSGQSRMADPRAVR